VFARRLLIASTLVVAPILFGQVTAETDDVQVPPVRHDLKVFTNSGTVNRVTKFASDGTTVIDSNFYDVNGALGVNTSNVMRMFTVENGSTADTGMRLQRFTASTHPYLDFLLVTSPATPYGYLQVGDDNAWRPLSLQPNGGNVGIRTTAPSAPLHVYSGATGDTFATFGTDATTGPGMNIGYAGASFGRGAAYINVRDNSPSAPNPSLRLMTADVLRMMITNTGNVGVGATVPTERFEVTGGSMYLNSDDSALMIDAGGNKRFGFVKVSGLDTEMRYTGIPFRIRRVTAGTLRAATASDITMMFTLAGNVGIGTATPNDTYKLDVAGKVHISGDLVADGNVAAKYQDVAEWVPATSDLAPGTVVVLDETLGNGVTASHSAYDTTVAGVVSMQPGIILGEGGANKEQVATTGRVRVKVDATRGAIKVGDLLVTSDKPGYAMKSVPVDVQGIAMHRPGTIVGKALEALNGGEGEILVLLSLQ